MEYIIYAFLSWVISGIFSAIFRKLELKNNISYLKADFIIQLIIFIIFLFVFYKYFSEEFIVLFWIYINWFFIFLIVSTIWTLVFDIFHKIITGRSIFDFYKI